MPYNVLIVEDQEMPKQLFEIFVNSSENYVCYITIDVLNEAESSPLHLTRYFNGGDRYAKEKKRKWQKTM